jgi:hypothetical protein
MHIRVKRSIEDIVAFSDHYVANSRYVKRAIARYRLFGALVIGGVTALVTVAVTPHVALFGLSLALALALIFAAQAGGIVRRHRRQMIRKLYTEGKNPPALNDVELEVMETGVIARTETTETRVAWNAIHSIMSTQDYTYLHLTPLRALIIPHKKVVEGSLPALLAEIGRRYHPTNTLPPGTL